MFKTTVLSNYKLTGREGITIIGSSCSDQIPVKGKAKIITPSGEEINSRYSWDFTSPNLDKLTTITLIDINNKEEIPIGSEIELCLEK